MLTKTFYWSIIIVLITSGCASLIWHMNEQQTGHPFIGTRQDAAGISCAWGNVFDQKNEIPWYLATPMAMVSSFVFFTDMVLSFGIDLVYLPKDLIDDPTELPSKICAPFNPPSKLNQKGEE